MSVAFSNINLFSQNFHRNIEAFGVKAGGAIGIHHPWTTLFLKIKHGLWGGQEAHIAQIKAILKSNIKELNESWPDVFSKENICTELFIASQRFNHVIEHLKSPLVEQLSLKPIKNLPEVRAVAIKVDGICKKVLEGIPRNQYPHVEEKGFWTKRKVFHYNAADTQINHRKEAMRIFISTQRERLFSLVGRVAETIAGFFGKKLESFSSYHYFSEGETDEMIYTNDSPLTLYRKASSYWIGHATCAISLPIGNQKINIITDPVEGDLHALLYPRMTKPARTIDEAPVPHVFMLSHNHLDHYDKSTLKKLVKYQPVMIVPEGDGVKLTSLGFKNVYEQNWWQQLIIPIEQDGKTEKLKITAVPANHWSGQGVCDAHTSAFLGYVIHCQEGDIYFAGDTARLSEEHIQTLKERFNIHTMFQPGGPDEVRKDMQSTHQASVDALWMHAKLSLQKFYEDGGFANKSKIEFIDKAKSHLKTIFMHTKTYKLGNLHFNDTDKSVERVLKALQDQINPEELKSYEKEVADSLKEIASEFRFQFDETLSALDMVNLLEHSVIIPRIGQRIEL